MAVQESGDKVHFLRKLIPGAADSSYGIYCARLAGLPGSIIDRAYGLLQGLEMASLAAVASEQGVVTQREQPATAAQSDERRSGPEAVYEHREDATLYAEGLGGADQKGGVVQLSIFGEEEVPEPSVKPGKDQHSMPLEASQDPAVKSLIDAVKGADVMNMTPIQAMQFLNDLKLQAKDM
jgi:DNA mismatch repair protein MutS